jgi:hypothetical protein
VYDGESNFYSKDVRIWGYGYPERNAIKEHALVIPFGASNLLLKNMYTAVGDETDKVLFGLSFKFITEGAYAQKRLPAKMFDQLHEQPTFKRLQAARPDLFRVSTDPEDAIAEISRFHVQSSDSPEETMRLMRGYTKDAQHIRTIGRALEHTILASVKGPLEDGRQM